MYVCSSSTHLLPSLPGRRSGRVSRRRRPLLSTLSARPPVPTRAHIKMWLCCMLWTLPGPLAAMWSKSASILLPPRVLIQIAAVERLRERGFRSCAARPAKEYGGDCSRLRARCAGEGECYVHSSLCVLRVSIPDIEGWDGCTYQFERPVHRSRASVSLILRDRM